MTEHHTVARRTVLGGAAATGIGLTVAGCIASDDGDPSGTDEDRIGFEELYEDAERETIVGETASQNSGPLMDISGLQSRLDPDDTVAENAAFAATQASKHTRYREDCPATIRYILDALDLDAYADARIAASGAWVTITEIYAENDDGSVRKVMVTKVPHNTSIPMQYSLLAGEEPGDMGAASDNNLAGMWEPTNLANISPIDYETLVNRVESYGGREEIEEENFRTAWENYQGHFNSYLLGEKSGDVLAPTAEAWRYIGEQERISRDSHEQAFENFRRVNEAVANRDIGEDQYLRIDRDGDGLSFEVVDDYHPAEIHDF